MEDCMRIAAILLYFFLITPIRIDCHFSAAEGELPRGTLDLRLWGHHRFLKYHAERNQDKIELIVNQKHIPLKRKQKNKKKKLPKSSANTIVRCLHLQIIATLCLADAAATAILCGVLTAAAGVFPAAKVNILPDYRGDRLSMTFHCIAQFRMGNLFLAIMKIGAAYTAQMLSGGKRNGNHTGSKNQLSHANGP